MSFCPYIILFYIQEAKFSYVPGNIISFLEIGLNLLLDLSFTSGFVTKVTTYWTMHFKMFQKHCICREYSVQFSHSVMSNSLQPHGIQHTRPPCLSPTAGVYSNWCPLSPWCHPTISSSVIPFSHLQSFPASGSFPWSQFFASGGQSIGVSSFNMSPSNEHPGLISFRMDWLDLIAVQGTLKSLLQHHSSKASILKCSAFFILQLSHPYRTTGETIA